MLKKTITYENVFTGEPISEDFYFNLSKAEVVELELSHKDGLKATLERIVEAKDGKGIVEEFQKIILLAYGKRSEDGRRFIKNDEVREEFKSTGAYSALFMELVTDTDAAVNFVRGIIPAGMDEEAAKIVSADLKLIEEVVEEVKNEPQILTQRDLVSMSSEEFQALWPKVRSGEIEMKTSNIPVE